MPGEPSFDEILCQNQHAAGTLRTVPRTSGGISLAQHRAPAHAFHRGASSDLLIIAQQNIRATSVEFDLGYGWREHISTVPRPVYVVPAEADARWRLNEASQCVFLSLPDADAQSLLRGFGHRDPIHTLWTLGSNGFAQDFVHDMVMRLWQESSSTGQANELLASSCRVLIMHALALHQIPGPSRRSATRLTRQQLQCVLERMHQTGVPPASIDALASAVGLSPWHFIRIFKNTTGKTPYCYYEELRAEKAKCLLRDGDLTMSAIAQQLGFAGTSQFSRAFRKMAGMPPTAYRCHARR